MTHALCWIAGTIWVLVAGVALIVWQETRRTKVNLGRRVGEEESLGT